jgi:hypothetical protein
LHVHDRVGQLYFTFTVIRVGHDLAQAVTICISQESPCVCVCVGGGGALVWCRREVYWWVDYRAAIGATQYDAPAGYIQNENIKQLRVACSERTCTVYCGCCDKCSTLNHTEFIRTRENLLSVVCSVVVE